MKFHMGVVAVVAALLVASGSRAQLFEDDFDVDPTANWTANNAMNVDDPQSQPANFFFDYSTIGIPSAPNSVGGTTRGMKLQANLDFDSDGISGGSLVIGMSASPTGLSIPVDTDFVMTADVWANYMANTTNGTSNLVTMGYGTSGTFGNYPGHSDALWFGAMTDGDTASDYRAYGAERGGSYQVPWLTTQAAPGVDFDPTGQPIDSHAVYLAGTRNNTGGAHVADFNNNGVVDAADYTLWRDWLGATGTDATKAHGNADGNSCPDGQNNCGTGTAVIDQRDYTNWASGFGGSPTLYTTAMPDVPSPPAAQIALFPQQDPAGAGSVNSGQAGTIAFDWHEYEITKVGNFYTWKIDGTTLITVDLTNQNAPLGGTNILFGMTDQNAGAPTDAARFDLLFALFDNIKVIEIPGAGSGGLASAGVPEPTSIMLLVGGLVVGAFRRRRM